MLHLIRLVICPSSSSLSNVHHSAFLENYCECILGESFSRSLTQYVLHLVRIMLHIYYWLLWCLLMSFYSTELWLFFTLSEHLSGARPSPRIFSFVRYLETTVLETSFASSFPLTGLTRRKTPRSVRNVRNCLQLCILVSNNHAAWF